jgi:tetratricopeptide (TPR) repeat protein
MLGMRACLEAGVKRIWMACCVVLIAHFCSAQRTTGSKEPAIQIASAVQQTQAQAQALEQQGKYPEAQSVWKSVVKAQPGNALAYAHLGLLEARQEHYPEAVTYYKKAQGLAQSQNTVIPQLNLNLGLALFKSSSFADAAQLFEGELKKHPGDQRLTTLVAMSDYGAHQYGAAIPYLKDAAAVDQQNLPLLLTLGHCYLWTREFDAALAVYKQILTINPDSAEADMIAGEALDEKGDREGAVQQFRAAEQANPREPNVHFALAYVLWTQKLYDAAIPEFKAELEIDPENNQAMIYLGDVYVRQGQYDLAKDLLKKASRLGTTDPQLHLDLGIVSMETGDNDTAVKELSLAIAQEPDNVTAHFRLATLYRTMGKKDEARVEFAKANSLTKNADDSLLQRIAAAHARPDVKAAQPQKQDAPQKPDQP